MEKEDKIEKKETENTEPSSTEKDKNQVENFGKGYNLSPISRTIPLMSDREYVKKRLESQMEWFDTKSSINQKKYKASKRVEFIIATIIPVVISLNTMDVFQHTILYEAEKIRVSISSIFQVLAALAGVILVIMNKTSELEEYYDNWKKYRATCESLQHERLKYLTRTEPYDEDDAFPRLVDKVETILSEEVQKWKNSQPDLRRQVKVDEDVVREYMNRSEATKEDKK